MNKGYFDQLLLNKAHIEKEMDGPLRWERLDEKRSCRIASYIDVRSVPPTKYDTLIDSAVRTALALYKSFRFEFAPPSPANDPTVSTEMPSDKLEELRLRYLDRLLNVKMGFVRHQTESEAYLLIDNAIISNAPSKLGSDSLLASTIVGNWRAPRHDYSYSADGTWTMLPSEPNSTARTWKIENGELLESGHGTGESSYRIVLLRPPVVHYRDK